MLTLTVKAFRFYEEERYEGNEDEEHEEGAGVICSGDEGDVAGDDGVGG